MQICPTFPPNIGSVENYVQLLADYLKKIEEVNFRSFRW